MLLRPNPSRLRYMEMQALVESYSVRVGSIVVKVSSSWRTKYMRAVER